MLARGKSKACNAGDAREGFAAKSKCGNRRKIVRRADFTRRMSLQRKQRVIAIHATAVIDDTNERNPSALNAHFNIARSCINSVFQQLFHNRGGPFHHLTSGHLTGKDFGKQFNPTHC